MVRPFAAALLLAAMLPAQTTWFVQVGGSPAGAGTVLAPLASIQQAIAAASPADEVLVGPGTYYEDLDFLGKAITVRSSAGPGLTTIQGTGTRSVVQFVTGEGNASILDGFRITGGDATMHGGGIWTLAAAPRIRDCLVVGNTAYDGGGITNSSGSATIIERCTIVGNVAWAGAYAGGGIRCSSSSGAVTVYDCILWDNNSGISGTPTLVQNAIVQGGFAGPGNLDVDPLFTQGFSPPSLGDFTLQPGSPALGSGTGGIDRGAFSSGDPRLRLELLQSGGPQGPITIRNLSGAPGAPYLSFFTVDPTNAASPGTGTLFGLHIPAADLTAQLQAPLPPFQGALDASGDSLFVLPAGTLGAALTGTTFHAITLTLDALAPGVDEAAPPTALTYL